MRKLLPRAALLPVLILLLHVEVQQCVNPAVSATEEISSRNQESLSDRSDTVEKTKGGVTEQVSVESTENSASEVQTNQPLGSDTSDTTMKGEEGKRVPSSSQQVSHTATVSPTLSAEPLLSEDQSDTITLSHSHNKLSDSDQHKISSSAPEQESSASSPSIVISVPSISSSMSSISSSTILPSASTTSAPEEIVTTNPLPDEDLTLYETVSLEDHGGHDFRNAHPKTVEVSPSKTSSVMEMTVPSYVRANPNRVGLLDGVIEEEDDHFLAHRAPQPAGGPLNQARSSVDGLASEEDKVIIKKSNRRAEPGPDISDILSGLLNVVGEGLSIATNYVQETNKKKAQEKVSTVDTEDVKPAPIVIPKEENKKNSSRINNRGPPLLSPIPFEAIPLEILQNQRPGARPGVAIPQRPFQTHLPPGISGPPPSPTISSPGQGPGGPSQPFKSGVTLPEQLVPTQALPTSLSPAEGESVAGQPSGLRPELPTRPGYSPDFSQDDDETQTTTNQKKQTKTKIKTEKNEITKPPPLPEIKPVSTDPFIDLLLNEIKEGKITTFPSSSSSTSPPPVEVEPSFTPPLLVTRPTTPRVRSRPPNRRPWAGGRPPRPKEPPASFVKKYPDWKYQARPQSSLPTPPLSSKASKRPMVFPTTRYPARLPAVVTGVAIPADNDVFDLTVTAQQNFGGVRKTKNKYQEFDGIITAARPGDQFVSIDGKRTYFDIGPTQAPPTPSPSPAGKGSVLGATKRLGGQEVFQPTKSSKYGQIVGSPMPVEKVDIDRVVQPRPYVPIAKRRPGSSSTSSRPVAVPTATRLPPAPPVRIDTCIVGNDKTCGEFQICKTYLGVSSCFCKPGYGRKNHRMPCKKTVRLLMSMKIDRIKDSRITWSQMYNDQNTAQYQTLSDEVNYAIGSAMSLTSFSNIFLGAKVNKFFSLNGAVTVNTTLEMEENSYTRSEILKRDIKNKLIEVIQARSNNIGSGNLYVSGPFNPIPGVEDFNECSEPEYNDCGDYSVCVNQFGGFTCQCLEGYGDKHEADPALAGRFCESCPAEHCSGRGECSIRRGERECACTGNFYGDQCQIDGEVLAVAIGASVAAVIIILLTLICLCMWSRRWKREQQKTDLSRNFPRGYMVGNMPAPNYMTKMSAWQPQPSPIYSVESQSQLRWAHHLDANGQNIYAPIVYSGVGPHIYGGESIYMAPPEPPRSIYGTLPRNVGKVVHNTSENSNPISTHYATFRRERLGPKVSLKLMQMMKADREEAQDTMSIISGFTENSGPGVVRPRKAVDESLYKQVSPVKEKLEEDEAEEDDRESLEPSRLSLAVGGGRMGPLPSIPRPSTALGTRQAPPLIETSESDDTEIGRGLARPRSTNSIMASNLTLDEEIDTEYLRYGGTVGVRNPRLVAQMRGAAGNKQQQQHIQMNLMAARGW